MSDLKKALKKAEKNWDKKHPSRATKIAAEAIRRDKEKEEAFAKAKKKKK